MFTKREFGGCFGKENLVCKTRFDKSMSEPALYGVGKGRKEKCESLPTTGSDN